MLPEVIPVLERVRDAMERLRALQAVVAAAVRGASGDGNLLADAWNDRDTNDSQQLQAELTSAAAQLDEWAIELKDPARGLIDFRSERDGRVVYLCYLLGEPTIAHWHELDAGFAGRQPL